MKYKVLITSSGTGSRLGKLTRKRNKSLVKVGGVEVILRTINSYPDSSEFVITIGYLGEDVKRFVKNTVPDKNITFVEVDCYEGEGSSLGYSLLSAESNIDCPFIFHCNDTLVTEEIPVSFSHNWIGWSKGTNNTLFNNRTYSSLKIENNQVSEIYGKKYGDSKNLHIGLVGIYDYEIFFKNLRELWESNLFDSSLNDVAAINLMLRHDIKFQAREFASWLDTGNLPSLTFAEEHILDSKHQ